MFIKKNKIAILVVFLLLACNYANADLSSNFTLTHINIDSPTNGNLFKYKDPFHAHAFIQGTGTGTILGYWYMDDIPLDYFYCNMTNGRTVQISTKNNLFTSDGGSHNLYIKIISPDNTVSNTVFYNVTEASSNTAKLFAPKMGAVFAGKDPPPSFQWTPVPNMLKYKIALVENTDHFDEINWQDVPANSWTPSKEYWEKLSPGTYYWAVKSIGTDNHEYPLSKVSYFRIIDSSSL
ncbi:MAG: hypothetical protein ABIH00_06055 [Armatimonadota bacterium]